MLDVLCIGDAKIDIILQIPDNDPHFSLDQTKQNLLINYGQKINIEGYKKGLGGNACNTAVGLSRLGKNIGICAEIGTDEFSTFIINTLQKEGLNISFIKQDADKPTSFSICLNYKGERTLLSEHVVRNHDFNFFHSSSHLLYLTSMGKEWQAIYKKTLEFIEKTDTILAFNPGTLQIEDRSRLVMDLISKTEYLFLNKEEAEYLLYGNKLSKNSGEIKKILLGLKSLGAKNIIVTDSINGSFALSEKNEIYHLPILKVDVVEKTGAGDAYNAGFISAVLESKGIDNAMIWGSVNSSSVIQQIGAQPGLLKKSRMEENLQMLGKYKPSLLS